MKAYLNGWQDKPSKGRFAWTKNRLEIGCRHQDFYIGYEQRLDYILQFNRDTAKIFYSKSNNDNYPDGNYTIDLKAWHIRSHGIKLAWHKELFDGFHLSPEITVLNAWRFQDGRLQGTLSANNQILEGTGFLNYRYSNDLLLEHQYKEPKGQGLALAVNILWQVRNQRLALKTQDIAGYVWWGDAPYTNGQINVLTEDEQILPSLEGRRGGKNYRQSLPTFTAIEYQYQLKSYQLHLDIDHLQSKTWVRPGITFGTRLIKPYIAYELSNQQYLLGLKDERSRFGFTLGLDRISLEQAKSITFEVYANIKF